MRPTHGRTLQLVHGARLPDWKIATFDAVTAQYVRLIGLETLSEQ